METIQQALFHIPHALWWTLNNKNRTRLTIGEKKKRLHNPRARNGLRPCDTRAEHERRKTVNEQASAWASGFTAFPNRVYGLGLSPVQTVVYLALLSFANRQGECTPSLTSIANRARVARISVVRALKALEEKFLIERIGRASDTGDQSSNLYRVVTWKKTPVEEGGNTLGGSNTEILPSNTEILPQYLSDTTLVSQRYTNKNHLIKTNEQEDPPASIRLRNARARASDDEHTTEIQPTRKSGQSPLAAVYAYGQQLGLTTEETQQEITKTQARNHTGIIRNPPAYLRKMLEVRAEQKTTQPVRLTAGQQAYLTNKTRYTQTATHTATAITEGQSHDNQTH